jgi:hypothetical protein
VSAIPHPSQNVACEHRATPCILSLDLAHGIHISFGIATLGRTRVAACGSPGPATRPREVLNR